MGRAEALQMEMTCKDWKLLDNLWAMVFDTTATNTGVENGACTIFEVELIKKKLLWLACRHHIDEVVLKSEFEYLFGSSSSPQNPCFTQFRDHVWPLLDKDNYSCLTMKSRQEKSMKEEAVKLYIQILESEDLPRGDYRECALLMLQILDVVPPKGVKWYKPAGTHNARWMSTILYTAKIFAFHKQIDIDQEYIDLYERFCHFSALIYVPWWLCASKGIDAPVNDLEFWKLLHHYMKVDKGMAIAALVSLARHLWYLSEELAPLCIFSGKLTAYQKTQIAKRILKYKDSYDASSTMGQTVMPIITERTKLVDLIGPKSWIMFSKFTETDWLMKPAQSWPAESGYTYMFYQVSHLKVVNDIAERGVKMVTDFSKTLTYDEEQKQCVYQVVEDHRKRLPKITKTGIKLMTIN